MGWPSAASRTLDGMGGLQARQRQVFPGLSGGHLEDDRAVGQVPSEVGGQGGHVGVTVARVAGQALADQVREADAHLRVAAVQPSHPLPRFRRGRRVKG